MPHSRDYDDVLTNPEAAERAGAGVSGVVLMQIRDSLAALSSSSRQQNETLSDVRERLASLEANDKRLLAVEASVASHGATLTVLVADKNRREGAIGAWAWLFKNWPGILALAAAVATISTVVLKANGKL